MGDRKGGGARWKIVVGGGRKGGGARWKIVVGGDAGVGKGAGQDGRLWLEYRGRKEGGASWKIVGGDAGVGVGM